MSLPLVRKPISTNEGGEFNSSATFNYGRNYCINGGFDVWQRGTTFNNVANSTYTADRWVQYNGTVTTVNVTRQDISSLGLGTQYCLRSERSAGTGTWVLETNLETSTLNQLKGKTITVSLLLRKGSALTSDLTLDFKTTTTEARGGNNVDATTVTVLNSSLNTTTFTRVSASLAIPASTAALGLCFQIRVASQAGAAGAYFEVAQVVINEGSLVAPYSPAAGTPQGELMLCMRYWHQLKGAYLAHKYSGGAGNAWTAYLSLSTPMRATPTIDNYSTATMNSGGIAGSNQYSILDYAGAAYITYTGSAAITIGFGNNQSVSLGIGATTMSGTGGNTGELYFASTSVVGLSAEL